MVHGSPLHETPEKSQVPMLPETHEDAWYRTTNPMTTEDPSIACPVCVRATSLDRQRDIRFFQAFTKTVVAAHSSRVWTGPTRPTRYRGSIRAALCARHEYEYCDVYVNRSDDNMLDVCFQDAQSTSDPTTTPQQCDKGDRQRCQSS